MVGLPTEEMNDLDGIINMINKILIIAKMEVPKDKYNRIKINVTISPFCPKPNTPFQWVGQDSLEILDKKINYLKRKLKKKNVFIKMHNVHRNQIEAIFARGDRRISKAIRIAWEMGCKFDSWTEQFSYDKWLTALKKDNVDISFYANRHREEDEIFPWEIIESGQNRKFLFKEYKKALSGITTSDCRLKGCNSCGLQEIIKCPVS